MLGPDDEGSRGGLGAWASARVAVSFLTIIPVRAPPPGVGGIGAVAIWFPIVGALVGVLAGGLRAALLPLLGGAAASVLAVATLVVLVGALHQDGLADAADGLGVREDRDRRIAVMRDPTVGTFGTLALVAWFLLMVSALAPLDGDAGARSLVAAASIGRWVALLHARALTPARPEGLGAAFAPTVAALAVASALTVAGTIAVCGPLPGGAALAAGVLAAAVTSASARRALGGRTGDTIGATIALAEAAIGLTLLGFWR